MVNHALRSFREVLFLVDKGNIRSRRAMEKIGGRLMSDDEHPEGTPDRYVIYCVDHGTA